MSRFRGCGLVAILCSTFVHPGDANAQARPDEALWSNFRVKARHDGKVQVLARLREPSGGFRGAEHMHGLGDGAVRSVLGLGAGKARSLRRRPLVAMTLNEATLEKVRNSGLFAEVIEDRVHEPHLADTVELVGAANAQQTDHRGAGIAVAILDTGVDDDHPSLNVVEEACFSDGRGDLMSTCSSPDDADACVDDARGVAACWHGTHVAGIAAASTCSGATCLPFPGVAPDADIIAINVFHAVKVCANGVCNVKLQSNDSDIIDGLDRVIELASTRTIAAVNLSLGSLKTDGTPYTSSCDTVNPSLTAAIQELYDLNIAVVISTGNEGETTGIGYPACISKAIAVGNTTKADAVNNTSNSSSLVDLLAPGTSVTSTAPISEFPGGRRLADGTSMSAPHVTGSIALLRQAKADLTVPEALAYLKSTGTDVTDARNGITRRRIDVEGALMALQYDQADPMDNDELGTAAAAGDFNGDGVDDVAVGAPNRERGASEAGEVAIFYGSERKQGPGLLQRIGQEGPLPGAAEYGDHFGASLAAADFDRDGFTDLAVGAPGESVGDVLGAGAVIIIPGSDLGLDESRAVIFTQSGNIPGSAESWDGFGAALATGDFNGDRKPDLAIGTPDEDIGTVVNAGMVTVVLGSPTVGQGLDTQLSVALERNIAGVDGDPHAYDYFGSALAAGNFDAVAGDDLAVGVAQDEVEGVSNAGSVQVFYSSTGSFTATNDRIYTQRDAWMPFDAPETGDSFGAALAAGDFDADGKFDLAIGIPNDGLGTSIKGGLVTIMKGAAAGLAAWSGKTFSQDSVDVPGGSEDGDRFGAKLHAGRLGSERFYDLIVGAPGEAVGSWDGAGAANVFYGSASGLSGTGSQLWHLDASGVQGTALNLERFGTAMATGDFDNDGFIDAVISTPRDSVPNPSACAECSQRGGSANVLFASTGSVLTARDVYLHY